ncbi:hypothetical protein [Mesorhizobium sp. M5C.F.Ca.IN.020.29.1.1]|uniref:hypothetical protein n=1 Tax=Mesorhizobium sp. M5C.F.Ca.IN.020.29.1.1 TaxID=2496770 RepID=UPI001FE11D73|nr:hypothetical protein [Mesorhizobium sp. M5C.F.Ca.IN.020.29.1.1]
MFLAHRRRKPLFEAAKELAEPAIAISVGMTSSILLPQDEERDAWLLELDGKIGPVRLCAPPRALFDAIASEEFVLKRVIG